jgi:hypothetical protein
MDSVLAISSGTVAAIVAALAINTFAARLSPTFLWAGRARRPTPESSLPAFRSELTIIGSVFRGPGCNWIGPWAQGVFFEP